ncbi:MAG: hypothetical protein IJ279_01325 [Clostridia bacterium]|nr:hypothetical protein [Clostridia bacterium]
MFTCIEVLPENKGFFTKLYEKIKPPAPEREYVQVRGATPFLRLKVRENNIDWREISSLLSKDERVVLKDSFLPIPEQVSLNTYIPRSLGINIMFRTMCDVLEEADRCADINLSVFDRDARLIGQLEKIVPLVRNATVYTEKISEYFSCASEIARESGMSIIINEYESERVPSSVVFADEYLPEMKCADFVFLADNRVLSFNTITGNGIFLEDEYKTLKGESIDDFEFASALYEMNNADFFAERDFISLSLSKKQISVGELAEKISQAVAG